MPVRREVRYGTRPDGTPLCFPVVEIGGTRPGPTMLFTAGIHGDEFEGPLALAKLADTLRDAEIDGKVRILPFTNSAALDAGTRLSPVDGVNLARVFPGTGGETASYRLARAIWALMDDVDVVFDCHSGGVEFSFMPVAGFYSEGGGVTSDAARRSHDLAVASGFDTLWDLHHQPGVLSYEAAKRGITAIGCEVGGRGSARPSDIALYHHAFLNILAHLGMVKRPSIAPGSTSRRILSGEWTLAPLPGLFEPVAELGSDIRTGDELARIVSTSGEVLHRFEASTEGVLMAERNLCRVREGDFAFLLAETEVALDL